MNEASGHQPPQQLLSSSACQPVPLCPPPCQCPHLTTPAWGQPGLEDTEATSPIQQRSDSSLAQAPRIESCVSFQLLHGEARARCERIWQPTACTSTPSQPASLCHAGPWRLACLLVTAPCPGTPGPSTKAARPAPPGSGPIPIPVEGPHSTWTLSLPQSPGPSCSPGPQIPTALFRCVPCMCPQPHPRDSTSSLGGRRKDAGHIRNAAMPLIHPTCRTFSPGRGTCASPAWDALLLHLQLGLETRLPGSVL